MTPAKGSVRGRPAPVTPATPTAATKPFPPTSATVTRRLVKRDLSSVSLSSMDEIVKAKSTGSRPSTSRTDSGSTVKSSKVPTKKLKAEVAAADVKPGLGGVGPVPSAKQRKAPRKEPHLIRNLGSPAIKGALILSLLNQTCDSLLWMRTAQGEMVWNASQQRWEGNESVLRDFDRVLSTSTRPALITHLSQGSPARIGFPSLPTMPALSTLRANAKVVGSMVFDPVRMSWYSLSAEEDELDLNFGEMADDEGDDADGWERGEHARMLKNRASFVMSEGSRDGESDAGDDGSDRRAIWDECVEGERRHRDEMRKWSPQVTRRPAEPDDLEREWLWDIRRVSTFH